MKRNAETQSTGVNLGLIITPMLDMSFQILAFFVMTYHPSALEGHVAGSLEAEEVIGRPAEDQEPVAPDPGRILDALGDVVTVAIRRNEGLPGQPGKVFVQRRTDPVPQQIADENLTWDAAKRELGRTLERLRKDVNLEARNVRIRPDAELRQEFVLAVYDVCRKSGFTKIHFVPPPR